MSNSSLIRARAAKNDEFYTLYEDIEEEFQYYGNCFRDKIVYCNCDNPYESNFVRYFRDNFERLGLKELRATCWSGEPTRRIRSLFREESPKFQEPYLMRMTRADASMDSCVTLLKGNGDFNSKECKALLESSDVVATNPPFSLFGDFMRLLLASGKDFVLICNKNALGTDSIVQRIAEGKCRVGHTSMSKDLLFTIPDEHAQYLVSEGRTESYVQSDRILGRAPAVWFTSLDYEDCDKGIALTKSYSEEDYPRYDNLDAIEIGHLSDIPKDWKGVMGVPITFLNVFNTEQFELLRGADAGISLYSPDRDSVVMSHLLLDGHICYKRLLIRNKLVEEGALNEEQ